MVKSIIYSVSIYTALLCVFVVPAIAQELERENIFFSTEEDFVTQGPIPKDGIQVISDGDLLNASGYIYMRNAELLSIWKMRNDLGLDAADVVEVRDRIVAFSTELDHPDGKFTSGDLLATNGAVLPNVALLVNFKLPRDLDLGLDAVHFKGKEEAIIRFLEKVRSAGRNHWVRNPEDILNYLKELEIDIWFSTEGTAPVVERPRFLDGDLLSALTGTVVARNGELLPATVPAGLPERGVDFGLDAVTCNRLGIRDYTLFSTEILYRSERLGFTDGDVIQFNNGVIISNYDLISPFEPKTKNLGLDALSSKIKR